MKKFKYHKDPEFNRTHRELMEESKATYMVAWESSYKHNRFDILKKMIDAHLWINYILHIPYDVINTRYTNLGCQYGIMIIGDSPEEDVSLRKVLGSNYLKEMIEESDIDEDKIRMSYLWKYKVPDERQLLPYEISEGVRELQIEIPYFAPNSIGLIGHQVHEVFQMEEGDIEIKNDILIIALPDFRSLRRYNSTEEREHFINQLNLLTTYESSRVDPFND